MVTSSARRALQLLLAAALCCAAAAPAAQATHSTKDHLSIGSPGGNGPLDVFFSFASDSGERAFFETPESLVAGDTDSAYDLYQRQWGATTLISTGPTGGNGGQDVFPTDATPDGTRVYFETDEALVAGDTDAFFDVYERVGSTTNLISIGPSGGNGDFDAFYHAVSANGSRVFFETDEALVAGDTDLSADIYERTGGTTTLISTGTPGNEPVPALFAAASTDGTRVLFETEESLVASDTDLLFDIYQRSGGTTTLISTGTSAGNGPQDTVFRGASKDATRVFFQTHESFSPSDTDTAEDVYERSGGTTTLVSAGANTPNPATWEGTSSDGTRVFFETRDTLAAGDTDGFVDVYERSGGTTKLVSAGTPGNGSFDARFMDNSAIGDRVVFETQEKLTAGDTDSSLDVYERAGGTTTSLLSTGPAGGNGAFDAGYAGMSRDGQRVLIESAEKLVASDTDALTDVYERYAGTTTHISTGAVGGNGAIAAFFAGVSTDGTRVFFDTREVLLSSDTDAARDLYVADIAGYPRPKGATPIRVPLVPAYKQCTSSNRNHGPPLAHPSCNPPMLESGQLTIGSPDANGAAANSTGFAKYEAIVGAPGGADDSDVAVVFSLTDVRRQGTLADYTGQLQADHHGASHRQAQRAVDHGVRDGEWTGFPVTVPCATTADTTIGSTCSDRHQPRRGHPRRGGRGQARDLAARQGAGERRRRGRRRVDHAEHAVHDAGSLHSCRGVGFARIGGPVAGLLSIEPHGRRCRRHAAAAREAQRALDRPPRRAEGRLRGARQGRRRGLHRPDRRGHGLLLGYGHVASSAATSSTAAASSRRARAPSTPSAVARSRSWRPSTGRRWRAGSRSPCCATCASRRSSRRSAIRSCRSASRRATPRRARPSVPRSPATCASPGAWSRRPEAERLGIALEVCAPDELLPVARERAAAIARMPRAALARDEAAHPAGRRAHLGRAVRRGGAGVPRGAARGRAGARCLARPGRGDTPAAGARRVVEHAVEAVARELAHLRAQRSAIHRACRASPVASALPRPVLPRPRRAPPSRPGRHRCAR